MPDGIIRDPKMNPRERAYGIVFINDYGGNFRYEKKQNFNRTLVAGSIVKFEIPSNNQIEYYPVVRTIDGIPIIGELKNVRFTDETGNENAPVINHLKSQGTETLTDQFLNELMAGKSDLIPE